MNHDHTADLERYRVALSAIDPEIRLLPRTDGHILVLCKDDKVDAVEVKVFELLMEPPACPVCREGWLRNCIQA
jgi:coenzyme F420-reducing hydrogenase beta subunit